MPFFDNIGKRREILLDNIYGVDLNEESIEITKLALFLKVSRKKLKLPNLNNNIKCGNSVVNDSECTEKPFKWEDEFREIFENGGFDIVIGNPPYVRQEKITEIKPYLKENYITYTGVADLYVYFFEKGLNILKEDGMFSFICSNKFTRANYGKNLRKFILNHSIIKYLDFSGEKVFEDATVDPCVIIIKKEPSEHENTILINDTFEILQTRLDEGGWGFENPKVLDLKEKIISKGKKIKDMPTLNFYRGVLTGYNNAFIIDKDVKTDLISKDPKNSEIIKPIIVGKDIKRWKIDYKDKYLIFTRRGIQIKNYPVIEEYLSQYKEQLIPKPENWEGTKWKGRKSGSYQWYEIQDTIDYYKEFEKKEKLVYPEIASHLYTVIDQAT